MTGPGESAFVIRQFTAMQHWQIDFGAYHRESRSVLLSVRSGQLPEVCSSALIPI